MNQAADPMVIFTRTFDFLTWLVPMTNHFPRAQRFTVTQRLLDAAFDLREHTEVANLRKGSARLAEERLARLRLTAHPGAHPRPVTEGIPFLGFVLYPDRRRLKRRKGIHFRQHLIARVQQYQAGEIALDDLTASVRGWINHVRYANTMGLRKAMLRSSIMTPPREAQHDRK